MTRSYLGGYKFFISLLSPGVYIYESVCVCLGDIMYPMCHEAHLCVSVVYVYTAALCAVKPSFQLNVGPQLTFIPTWGSTDRQKQPYTNLILATNGTAIPINPLTKSLRRLPATDAKTTFRLFF